MRVGVLDNLLAAESSYRGAEDDVGRPVPVVIHSRKSDHGRATVHEWPDHPRGFRPPGTGLRGHCGGGGERRRRVA